MKRLELTCIVLAFLTACGSDEATAEGDAASGDLDVSDVGFSPGLDGSNSDAQLVQCEQEPPPTIFAACDPVGLLCHPTGGYDCCYCVSGAVGCDSPNVWLCGQLGSDCPDQRPVAGSPCSGGSGTDCTYCELPPIQMSCVDGRWVAVQAPYCPPKSDAR